MIIVGDVHGKVIEYHRLVKNFDKSRQVGDFGFQIQHNWFIDTMDSMNHKINFGNHDYIPYKYMNHSCGDYSYEDGIFTVRGARSIDTAYRTEGLDWFRDEELRYGEMIPIFDLWEKEKPEIVLTHDCPQLVAETLFTHIHHSYKSVTRQCLQELFEIHQPTLWIFGHHHKSRNQFIDGTRFICLEELETYTL